MSNGNLQSTLPYHLGHHQSPEAAPAQNNDSTTPLTATWSGWVETTMDALLLFEACLCGHLSHVPRRPHDRERNELIRSGNVFIYEENASGIKRWTDGNTWSPSRILNNFLIYRELAEPFPPGEKKRAKKANSKKSTGGAVSKSGHSPNSGLNMDRVATAASTLVQSQAGNISDEDSMDRQLVGSLVDSYNFKEGGLVKKTISIVLRGIQHHMVSYYNVEDVKAGRLKTPLDTPLSHTLQIRQELVHGQTFRSTIDGLERYGMMGVLQQGAPAMDGYARSLSVPSVPYQVSPYPPTSINRTNPVPPGGLNFSMGGVLPPPSSSGYMGMGQTLALYGSPSAQAGYSIGHGSHPAASAPPSQTSYSIAHTSQPAAHTQSSQASYPVGHGSQSIANEAPFATQTLTADASLSFDAPRTTQYQPVHGSYATAGASPYPAVSQPHTAPPRHLSASSLGGGDVDLGHFNPPPRTTYAPIHTQESLPAEATGTIMDDMHVGRQVGSSEAPWGTSSLTT